MFNTFGISVVIDKCKESVVNVEVIKFEFGDQLFSNAFEMQNDNLSRRLQIIGIWNLALRRIGIWKSIILECL